MARSGAAATQWLVLGAGALLLLWLASKAWKLGLEKDKGTQGSGPGGVLGLIDQAIGGSQRNELAQQTDAPQDFAGEDHESTGVGSQAVTGQFLIESGDTVNRELFAGSVRIPLALVNSGPSPRTVLVQMHCYWDFLADDDQTTWEELVVVPGLGGKHVEADLGFPSWYMARNPNLYLDLTVAGVHQDRIEGVSVA